MVLSKKLRNRNLSQTEIASKLELTQAAVSKYLAQNDDIELASDVEQAASRIEALILSGASSDKIVDQVCSTCMQSRIGGDVCTLHRERVDSLGAVKCQICVGLLGGKDKVLASRAAVLRDMEDALMRIESLTGFERIMPQVRANLASCGEDASSAEEVAAVPGRITLIEGRARALVPPRYGASSHTARILLSAMKKWPSVRSCLCISGRENVASAAQKVGFRILQLEEPQVDAETIGSEILKRRVPPKKAAMPAVRIPGGIGVEAILYLFSPNAMMLADMCQKTIGILGSESS
jgi:hypothetical protein